MTATAEETNSKIPKVAYFKGRILVFYTKFSSKKKMFNVGKVDLKMQTKGAFQSVQGI